MSVAVSVSRPTLEASLMTRAVGENTPKGGGGGGGEVEGGGDGGGGEQ